MHNEVLNQKQLKLLPILIENFIPIYGLVGGTAIALQLGHRKSIDFDLFTNKVIDTKQIKDLLRKKHTIEHVFVDSATELTVLVDGVRVTFYQYPFKLEFSNTFDNGLISPSLITLTAMKAFALGRRSKWKDYVDLYYLLQKFSFEDVILRAKELFGNEFNAKLFRVQLAYYNDIDYTEQVDFISEFQVSDEKIMEFLRSVSVI